MTLHCCEVILDNIRALARLIHAIKVALACDLPRLGAVASAPSIIENVQHPVAGAGVRESSKVELGKDVMLSWFAHSTNLIVCCAVVLGTASREGASYAGARFKRVLRKVNPLVTLWPILGLKPQHGC